MNDFVQGMEMLLNCKKYMERRLSYLKQLLVNIDNSGRDPSSVQREIGEIETILGGYIK
jgi:hypothetical protein